MKRSQAFAVAGFLLGWGAPTGALFLRYLLSDAPGTPWDSAGTEWAAYAFFYWYMAAGTCLVFAVLGWVVGRYEDREIERHRERLGS